MDFLGIGGGEIIVIIILALIIFGPGRIVEFARSLGNIVNNLKKGTADLSSQVVKELDESKQLLKEEPSSTLKGQPEIRPK